jgi:hypothetical protein
VGHCATVIGFIQIQFPVITGSGVLNVDTFGTVGTVKDNQQRQLSRSRCLRGPVSIISWLRKRPIPLELTVPMDRMVQRPNDDSWSRD